MKTFKSFCKKYRHMWIASLYLPFYMTWFTLLEHKVTTNYYVVHCHMDNVIPFNELFLIPYLLWFLLVPAMFFYLGFTDKKQFIQFVLFLFGGMTLYLIICTVFPNGQNMRPAIDFHENVLTRLMQVLWSVDTSTNVFPSIHAYNSIAVAIATVRNDELAKHPLLFHSTLILCMLICLATVFLKQHSVLDVLGAVIMALLFYRFIYGHSGETEYEINEKHAF